MQNLQAMTSSTSLASHVSTAVTASVTTTHAQQSNNEQYAQPCTQIKLNNENLPTQPTQPTQPSPYAAPIAVQSYKMPPTSNTNAVVNLPTNSAPPIPEPDYSLSESDGEDENSILVARNTKLNEKISITENQR